MSAVTRIPCIVQGSIESLDDWAADDCWFVHAALVKAEAGDPSLRSNDIWIRLRAEAFQRVLEAVERLG